MEYLRRISFIGVGDSAKGEDETVGYPIHYPPPRLQSFSINNLYTDYDLFDFERVSDWLQPNLLADSLQYIRIGPIMDVESVKEFIADLGNRTVVHTLHFFVEITEDFRE